MKKHVLITSGSETRGENCEFVLLIYHMNFALFGELTFVFEKFWSGIKVKLCFVESEFVLMPVSCYQ